MTTLADRVHATMRRALTQAEYRHLLAPRLAQATLTAADAGDTERRGEAATAAVETKRGRTA